MTTPPENPPPARGTAKRAPAARRSGAATIEEPRDDALSATAQRRRGDEATRKKSRDAVDRVSGEVFGRPSGIRASAGRALGVALLCFAIWTLLDANELYHSAADGPIGTRRSVAMTVLRPVAAVANSLHLSGLVTWGENLVGHGNGTAGQSQNFSLPTIPGHSTRPPQTIGGWMTPHPHGKGYAPTQPTGPTFDVPPIVPPSAAHPLTILDIGDSVGQDLGYGLGDVFTGDPDVKVIQAAQESTGVDRPDYYNWPGHLEQLLKQNHPQVVVVMMGDNDDQNLNERGNSATQFCPTFGPPCVVTQGSAQWKADYTARVRLLMEYSLLSGAHVLWVGLPPNKAGAFPSSAFCAQVNSIDQAQAASLPDVTFVSSWYVIGNSRGQYVVNKVINGSLQEVRDDPVHLAPAGWDLLANYLVDPMQQAWGIKLHVAS